MIKTIKRLLGLHSERLSKVRSAARNLREGKLEDAEKDLKWAESYSRVLAFIGIGKKCLVIICDFLIALAYTCHPSAPISFKIRTENVSMTLAENWASDHSFTSDRVFANNLVEVGAFGLNIPREVYPEENAVEMDLKGKDINVNELILLANTKVEFNAQGDMLRLFAKGEPLAGELFAQNGILMLEAGGETIERTIDSEIPETISFRSARTVADPVRFEFATKDDWQLRGLLFREIGFLEEYPPGSGNFISAIHSGKITFSETGTFHELGKGESLILKGPEIRRMEISKAGNDMEIFFEGTVDEASAGPRGFERDMTPSWLKWIYHQQRVAFFWIAFAILVLKNLLDVAGAFMSL